MPIGIELPLCLPHSARLISFARKCLISLLLEAALLHNTFLLRLGLAHFWSASFGVHRTGIILILVTVSLRLRICQAGRAGGHQRNNRDKCGVFTKRRHGSILSLQRSREVTSSRD